MLLQNNMSEYSLELQADMIFLVIGCIQKSFVHSWQSNSVDGVRTMGNWKTPLVVLKRPICLYIWPEIEGSWEYCIITYLLILYSEGLVFLYYLIET